MTDPLGVAPTEVRAALKSGMWDGAWAKQIIAAMRKRPGTSRRSDGRQR